MSNIEVYDKPMCCSTGVCGPQVDEVLPRFAADLSWLSEQGFEVHRFNLAQNPKAFIENKVVHEILSTQGTDCLPVVLVNGQLVSREVYPTRDELLQWLENTNQLPVADAVGCCGSSSTASSCCAGDGQSAQSKSNQTAHDNRCC